MPQSAVDVLIMTALAEELRAVVSQSAVEWESHFDPPTGLECLRAELDNGLRVALAGTSRMGPVSSAIATTHAITALRPSRVVLTGIAAGIGDQVNLGDILVSDQIVDYDAGKVKNGAYAPRWQVYAADPTLSRAARLFRPSVAAFDEQKLIGRPDHSSELPQVHVGTILAGSKVVADASMVGALRKTWSQAIGLEMEGGGGAAAAHEHSLRPTFIIIKGVCDRGTATKDDAWHVYAAHGAAAYTLGLLSSLEGRTAETVRGHPMAPAEEPGGRASDQFMALGMTPAQLQAMLKDGFTMDGLMALCVDLDIDIEDIQPYTTKTGAVASIVGYCKRRVMIKPLVIRIREVNPGLFDLHT